MAFGYGFGSCGCSTWCTHRKLHDDPEIQWSKNATGSDCDTGATVLDSAIDGDGNVYVVGHWNSTFNVYGFAIKYNSSGVVQWTKYFPRAVHCCSTDDTYLWIGGDSGNFNYANAYKLSASDGSTVWSKTTNHEVFYDCVPDGAGGVYFCGSLTGPGFVVDCGYCSRFDSDGDVTSTFGGTYFGPGLGATATIAYSIDLSGGFLYIGSTVWRAWDPACSQLLCGPTGSVAKFTTGGSLIFLFGEHTCVAVKAAGESLYCGFGESAACQLQKWLIADVTREWGRTLQVDKPLDGGYPFWPEKVTDIDVSQSGVYVTHQWWVSKLDHNGNYLWSNRHAVEDEGKTYFTVEVAPEDGYAYSPSGDEVLVVGGRPARCSVEDQDDSTTPATCDCEPEDICEQTPNTVGPFGGIYSWICTGEEIPCSVPDTFYGSGCFSEITPINHTWTNNANFTDGPIGYWTTEFDIPCGEDSINVQMTATQVSGDECDGWEVTAVLSGGPEGCSASGAATVTACWCSEDSPYDHPWFEWEATFSFEDCECCDEGGGGNEEPEGVPSDCCVSDLPTTLTISLASSSCPAANGATGTLTWNESEGDWAGIVTVGGTTIGFALDAGSCTLSFPQSGSFDCYAQPAGEASSLTCDPLIATWNTVTLTGSNCCGGSGSISDLSVTITE